MYAETIAHISDCSALNPRWGESGALTTAAKPMGSDVGSGLDQHMDGEVPADAERRSEELLNRFPGALDVLHDVGLPERAVRIVIRQVAFALQLRELLPELPHLLWKRGRDVLAGLPGIAVVERPVHPPPHRPTAGATGQTVRAGARQTMEQGVVGGADRATQICSPRPAGIGLGEVSGDLKQVTRVPQRATPAPPRSPTRR